MYKRPFLDIGELQTFLGEHGIEATRIKYGMSRDTLKAICREHKIEIPSKGRGRPAVIIPSDRKQWIADYRERANIGYQQLSRISGRYDVKVSEWAMRKNFQEEDLFLHRRKPDQKKMHPNRFVANFAGQTWHTDLHYLKKQQIEEKQLYLIAFIDDRTRKILHHEIIGDKSCPTVAKALMNALSKAPKPRYMVNDNGTEFTGGNFQKVLFDHHIIEHRIHAYTPEENGKIERWWQTLEKSATQPLAEPYLTWLIGEYNSKWDHIGLKELTGNFMTPDEAWSSMEHWENQPASALGYEYNKKLYSVVAVPPSQ